MDLKTATAIRKAFGPATGLYECNTPEEIVKYAELNTMSPAYFAKVSLDCEDVQHEHDGISAYAEWMIMKLGIRLRLKRIGIDLE